MSGNIGSSEPTQPLNVGNVVSAGLKLYRSHLKDYFLVALKAYFWLLVPFYGWAKFYAQSALIARLAFGDLVNQPESVTSGQRFVNSRLWQFFINLLLMLLLSLGIFMGFGLLVAILIFILSAALSAGLGGADSVAVRGLIIFIGFIIGATAFLAALWFVVRFYLADIPLAIEEDVDGVSSIGRSWELAKGYVWRILLILFVSSLIMLPIQIIIQLISTFLQIAFAPLLREGGAFVSLVFFLLVISIGFVGGALIIPFSQSIRAVIYYDLRSRREGLGLRLRDREI